MADFGLGDGLRLKHPKDKEFFFSRKLITPSRIKYFLISNSIISKITDIVIYANIISWETSMITLSSGSKKILSTDLNIAKKTILMNWKTTNYEYRSLEKLIDFYQWKNDLPQ